MQILNITGNIKVTQLSSKLGIGISNIPAKDKQQIIEAIFFEHSISRDQNKKSKLLNVANKVLSKKKYNKCNTENDFICAIVDKLICIRSLNFEKSILKHKNRVDNPIDQFEYSDKFFKFLSFMLHRDSIKGNFYLPNIIYNPHFFYDDKNTHIIDYLEKSINIKNLNSNSEIYIKGLINFCAKVDNFLKTRSDFDMLDYMISTISSFNERDYNAVHFMCIVTLLEMLLVSNKTNDLKELDYKLPGFFDNEIDKITKTHLAIIIRKIRNKIGHGDFTEYHKLCEEYAKIQMKNFIFDYSEFDRESWIISNLCMFVDDCLSKAFLLMMENPTAYGEIINNIR